MNVKKYPGAFIRKLHLAGIVDKLRYLFYYSTNYLANTSFKKSVPHFTFPPPYFIYETYSLNYKNYYTDGFQTAKEIAILLSAFRDFSKMPLNMLDWGCGPGRIVRHMPVILSSGSNIYGCDYNGKYVDWCSQHIASVHFIKNNLHPPTTFNAGYFDVIYGLSIITHLSAASHTDWIRELWRILKPGGILLITAQGVKFEDKLLAREKLLFSEGKLVVRESKNEGHRIFSAFQPKDFMLALLSDFTLIKFIEGGSTESIHGLQDTWVVQKPLT